MPVEGLDASTYITAGLGVGLGRANRSGLRDAYREAIAVHGGIPVLIPAGSYEIELDPAISTTGPVPVLELSPIPGLDAAVPIIGAGADVTVLKFTYSPLGRGTIAFRTVGSTHARILGLKLEGPDDLGGDEADGTDAPDCWAIYVSDASQVTIIDASTTLWNEAIRIDGSSTGATVHLERCEIKSRGTRVRHISPPDRQEEGGLTLVNCTIEQDGPRWKLVAGDGGLLALKDVGGFLQPETGYDHCGILQDPTANLVVIGGRSLGGRSDPYDIANARVSSGEVSARQISITNHHFGPNSRAGLYLFPFATAVQIDNCLFAGENGIIMSGPSATYHVSDCAFVGGRLLTGEGTGTYFSGHAVSDSASALANEVEALFSNCRFGPTTFVEHTAQGASQIERPDDPRTQDIDESVDLNEGPGTEYVEYVGGGYEVVVVRYRGSESKPWQFENCHFGPVRNTDGALFRAQNGVNRFFQCRFVDPRPVGRPVGLPSEVPALGQRTLEQAAGRMELHACHKEGTLPIYFAPDGDGLEVVLERNVFWNDSVVISAHAPLLVRGSENYFGEHVYVASDSDPALVTGALQLRRGRSLEMPAPWSATALYLVPGELVRHGDSPTRIYALVSGTGPAANGPTGTDSRIIVGGQTWEYVRDDADYEYDEEALVLGWNADWVELDRIPTPTIRTVQMRGPSEAAGRAAIRLVGGTIQLFAVRDFVLGAGGSGSGAILTSADVRYVAGQVATLRYSAQDDAWGVL